MIFPLSPLAPLPALVQEAPPAVRVGKYVVELRPPEGGVFAGEEVDVEFAVLDATKEDPKIGGLVGVKDVTVAAKVTMPSMAGMPAQTPKIHREGIEGVYGLELYFPHGGGYRIELTLTPKGEAPIRAAFNLEVRDADAKRTAKSPFALRLLSAPKRAGIRTPLRMAIIDKKTGQTVRDFDVAHERRFHLVIVSRDLGYFVHEHPRQTADGTWIIDRSFPAGTSYTVFADVAPKGRGSQYLAAPLNVAGPKPTWTAKSAPSGNVAKAGGIVARFRPTATPIPTGRSTGFAFALTDARTRRPVTDLQPYLGAFGHLMIVHQDGSTFVHSHPAEDAAGLKSSRAGTVVFNGRLPKAGLYKAWGQFQRNGKVITVPFTFRAGAAK